MAKRILFLLLAIFIGVSIIYSIVLANGLPIPNPLPNVHDFKELFVKIVSLAGGIIGAAAGLMVVIAGMMFIFSGGSPENISKAKAALMYALIGAVIAGLAEAIATVVTSAFP